MVRRKRKRAGVARKPTLRLQLEALRRYAKYMRWSKSYLVFKEKQMKEYYAGKRKRRR